ncbi:MAG: UxaA family hydrolase [Proteobacteria bacterium]|nr:UxaA family hydrolase [Pseudomonadota bacterium]
MDNKKPNLDPRLVLLSPEDNCLVACTPLAAGTTVQLEEAGVTLARDIGMGHKLARRDLNAGEKVIKYGAVIGSLNGAVRAGEHIHTHNLSSDYTPTYTLDEGHTYVGH